MLSDKSLNILELINQGKCSNEICEILNISSKQLYYYLSLLKLKGHLFDRLYYSSGNIKYEKNNKDNSFSYKNNNIIKIKDINGNMKFCVISDLHIGNKLSRLDLIDKVYDYCINNNINVILCCGDLLDGTYTKGEQSISDTKKQIDFFIKNYPFDKNIYNITIGGDHDRCIFENTNQDFKSALDNFRHDIVMLDYNLGFIGLKQSKIALTHAVNSNKKCSSENNVSIILEGHHHKYFGKYNNNILCVSVPTLSNIMNETPSFLDMKVDFEYDKIKNVNLKQFIYLDKFNKVSEYSFELSKKESGYLVKKK